MPQLLELEWVPAKPSGAQLITLKFHMLDMAAGFGFLLVWSFLCYVPVLLLWNKDVYLCYILEVCNVFLIL